MLSGREDDVADCCWLVRWLGRPGGASGMGAGPWPLRDTLLCWEARPPGCPVSQRPLAGALGHGLSEAHIFRSCSAASAGRRPRALSSSLSLSLRVWGAVGGWWADSQWRLWGVGLPPLGGVSGWDWGAVRVWLCVWVPCALPGRELWWFVMAVGLFSPTPLPTGRFLGRSSPGVGPG